MEEKFTKDCEVEVCSEEEGFNNAWFRGILEDNPRKSGRKRRQVRYLTLLDEDGSSPLIEFIEPRFIRPVPPEDEYNSVVLEEGSMVDADLKDGWWTGVVIKILENDKFWVYYDSPPDIIEFERNQLRAHLRWTGSKWEHPEFQGLDYSEFSSGTMVEVLSERYEKEIAWFSAVVVKEIEVDDEKIYIVKHSNLLSSNGEETNLTVDSCRIRPTPPPLSVEKYDLLECVEAFHDSLWHHGLVRGVLSENQFLVSLGITNEQLEFKQADVRPYQVWEDGVWHKGPKRNVVKKTPSNVIKTKSMRSCSGEKLMTPKRRSLTLEKNGEETTKAKSGALATRGLKKKRTDNDSTPLSTILQAKPIAKRFGRPVTPSRVKPATSSRGRDANTRGKTSPKKTLEPMKNVNGLKYDSSQKKVQMSEEKNSEDKTRKRKRKEEQNSDFKKTDETGNGSIAKSNDEVDDQPLSSWIKTTSELDHTPIVVNEAAVAAEVEETQLDHIPIVDNEAAVAAEVEETQANDTLTVLPFAKKSPFWKTCEEQEICRRTPQNPHFGPLFEAKEDHREFTAVGMMVTFYGLLEEVNKLQLNASSSKLSDLSSSFAELDKHGFDVADPQSRINNLMALQNERAEKVEERKCLEKKIETEEKERLKFEEEKTELERKIQELKVLELVAKEKVEVAENNILGMKSCTEIKEQEIQELELKFKTIAKAPW